MTEPGNHLFSVAIDFGTTYSGYAYSSIADFKKRPDQIYANETWNAGGQGLLSRKTPTCLLLKPNKEFAAFGYEAENEYSVLALDNEHKPWYFFRRYKMKLHGDEEISEKTVLEDETGKPLPALVVFSHSIRYLKEIFQENIHKKGIDIQDDEIMWTLTVPAIWRESAKGFMRRAAVEAGIKTKQLKIALEPEAASIFCQHIHVEKTEEGFSVAGEGTKYMVVDLGGGTADITVHEKLSGGKLKEIYKATGGAWGGTAVDEGYLQLLTRIVGGPAIHRLRRENTSDFLEMMREFEVSKRTVGPQGPTTFKIRIPVCLNGICKEETDEDLQSLISSSNSPFAGKLRIVADKCLMEHSLIAGVFQTVEQQIVDHLKEILKLPEVRDVSIILLVGGFSESAMVQHVIKEELQTNERRILIPAEAGLSVVKGAVIFGHQPTSIDSRIVRYTYGFNVRAPFIEGVHPESRKVINAKGKTQCKGVLKPFITAGTSIKVQDVTQHKLNLSSRENDVLVLYYTDAQDVMFTNDPRLRKLYKVKLSDILPNDAENGQPMIYQFSFGETEVTCDILLPLMKFEGRVSYKLNLE